MTISSTNTKNSYSGDGSTVAFSYTFKILDDDDIQVILRTNATGTETVQTKTTHYSVSGVGNAGGGTITFVSAPAATETVVLLRNVPLTQTTDYTPNDPFPAVTHEDALDKLTLMAQDTQEEVDRSIKLSRTNTMTSTEFTVGATARANKVFAFDSSGELAVTQEIGTFQGDWAASTAYAERDLVKDTSTNNIFIVNSAHTSSGSQPLTTNPNASKYDLIVDAASATTSATNAATSATAAATSATAAANSATAAATSESNAAASEAGVAADAAAAAASAASASTSETNASTSETNAANSASAAATSATNAATSATSASNSASSAGTSETNAATSATNASNSASAAATSASNASTSETNAATSESNASTSASSASTSASNAAASAAAAAASFDAFDDIYLGAKASAPTVDNDGDALTNGDLYFDTGDNELYIWNGSAWQAASPNIVADTTPQLGGNLDTNGNDINFGDNAKAIFGAGSDLQVFHDATDSHVVTTSGDLNLQVAGGGTINLGDQFGNTLLKVVDNADVKLYHGTTPSQKLATTSAGIDVTGTVKADGIVKSGATGSNGQFDLARASDGLSVGKITMTESSQVMDYHNALGSGIHSFTVNSTERVRIDSSGNLTFSQEASGSPYPEQKIKWSNDSTTANGFYVSQDTSRNGRVWHEQGLDVLFGTANTERMRIDYNGNLLVGTTTPQGDDASLFGPVLTVDSGSYDGLIEIAGNRSDGDNTGVAKMQFIQKANSATYKEVAEIAVETDGATANKRGGSLLFKTRADNSTDTPTRMTIDSSGNVGIGTTSPGVKVESNGSFRSTGVTDPTSGAGLELCWRGTSADVLSYDRDTSQFKELQIRGAPVKFLNAGGERMRIDSSGSVKIGNTANAEVSGDNLVVGTGSGDNGITVYSGTSGAGNIYFSDGTGGDDMSRGTIRYYHGDNTMRFWTNAAERMRIDSSGGIFFGKTSTNDTVSGFHFIPGDGGRLNQTSGSAPCMLLNRHLSDGDIVLLRQANVTEGTISVSGSTVSYNGGHLSRFSQAADGSRITGLVKGTVMTNLDQMAVWSHDEVLWTADDELPDGVSVGDVKTAAFTEDNEQLNCMAVSSVEGDANVAGVFVNWDDDDEDHTADMNIAMTGDMVIRIAQGTTVARGDLLMSAGDGTAKPQGDDIVRSKTIAKVTSTTVSHTYDDGSYLVPCVLMAC